MERNIADGFQDEFMTMGLQTLHACYATRETISSVKMKHAFLTLLRELNVNRENFMLRENAGLTTREKMTK